MTNFEFYKADILKVIEQGATDIAIVGGKIRDCEISNCNTCMMHGDCCESKLLAWLAEEHVEKPKLTKAERAFCEATQKGFIAKDMDGLLCLYRIKPTKGRNAWECMLADCIRISSFFETKFEFIKWDDAEPWSIESLLKLEVEV